MPRMRGVTVVGCGLDSGEAIVAAGAYAAARAAGEDARLFVTALLGPSAEADAGVVTAVAGTQPARVFRAAAAPLIAAKHAGTQLDPASLVEEARSAAGGGLLVAAAPGGLLAPLSEHYSVRDFARELGLPIVIAARAAGGVTSQVRLVGEAARAAGVAVAAVVLTGWPDPPNRVQLDERELLAKAARVQVLTLAEDARSASAVSEAASRWPVGEWAETAAAAAGGPPSAAIAPAGGPPSAAAAPAGGPPSAGAGGPPAAAAAAAIVLDPYDAWQPRQLGDPRNTPRPRIMQAMLEIVEAEGPMTATRAYSLYNRAAGGRKLTSVAKAPLSSAVYWLARENRLTLTREADIPWQADDMVRLNDQPAVRVRELGSRALDEVPLDEIAELVKLLRAGRGPGDPIELKRAILSTYGLVRLTGRADEYLGLAIDLAS